MKKIYVIAGNLWTLVSFIILIFSLSSVITKKYFWTNIIFSAGIQENFTFILEMVLGILLFVMFFPIGLILLKQSFDKEEVKETDAENGSEG